MKKIENSLYENIIINGYTDNTSTEEFNKRLSWLRANSVAQYLILNGISPEKIKIHSFGENNLSNNNNTKKNRTLNRRVEIYIQ